ncbi:MAG: cbb3-type cytochrome c oxidase N-terminal domain-containing protein [Roseibacillus sp.]
MKKKHPEEEAPLRDHAYDGIQEYDHKLPNWWLYTLYAAIVYFVVDWGLYYKTDWFKTDQQKVSAEIQQIAEERKTALAATLSKLDDKTLVHEWATDSARIARGEAIYNQVCIGCHAADMSATMIAGDQKIPLPGLALNDGEWKYGATPLDIFKIINDGTPADSTGHNGAKMQPWGQTYSAQQVAEITAFLIAKNPDEFTSY